MIQINAWMRTRFVATVATRSPRAKIFQVRLQKGHDQSGETAKKELKVIHVRKDQHRPDEEMRWRYFAVPREEPRCNRRDRNDEIERKFVAESIRLLMGVLNGEPCPQDHAGKRIKERNTQCAGNRKNEGNVAHRFPQPG